MEVPVEEYRVWMKKLKCLRCSYEWYPRTPIQPKVCPKCKSPYWNRPRTKEVKNKLGRRFYTSSVFDLLRKGLREEANRVLMEFLKKHPIEKKYCRAASIASLKEEGIPLKEGPCPC